MPDISSRYSRRLKRGLALLLTGLALDASAQDIASIDWTLAETLSALGAPPAAVAQVGDYHSWVGKPHLPEGTSDLGLRTQPNLEQLAQHPPERILISPMFASLAPRLERVAPVETLALYTPDDDTWTRMLALTRDLGGLVGRPQAAETLIASTATRLEELRNRLPRDPSPLLVVQFMDERHVRVFGGNGLFQVAMDRLGLENAWQETTNYWGFSLVGVEALLEQEARLVVIEPYPIGVEERLANSALWQHHPSVREGSVITLPPVWSFGALPSLRRFAELLVDALAEAPET
ncbi:ABC transporter substrate-binding protein [Billgrantia antri]|uniref:ABC transporter substrate-binding protein n=1 Tax=Billgrantia antri TaxID=2846777 RepID=UPI003B20D69C